MNGAPSDAQFRGWERKFSAYRKAPSIDDIRTWLHRFSPSDREFAQRILDHVLIVSEQEIQEGYRKALNGIPGWKAGAKALVGKWVFMGFGAAGESGPHILRCFREANDLTDRCFQSMFKSATDLPYLQLGVKDTVILVDDFSGSGKQIVEGWPAIRELVVEQPKFYLILSCITRGAASLISEKLGLRVIAERTLAPSRNVFDVSSKLLNPTERTRLLHYCRLADRVHPKGFGECGLLVVMAHKTPNNSLPILHANHNDWTGLFPRKLLRTQ